MDEWKMDFEKFTIHFMLGAELKLFFGGGVLLLSFYLGEM